MDEGAKAVARALYSDRLKNQVAPVRALFTDDANIQLPGGEGSTPTLDHAENSAAATDAYIQTLVTLWRWETMEIHTLIESGNRVVCHYTLTTVFVPTGERITTQLCDLFTLRDGKIAEFIEFVDIAMVERLAQSAEGEG